MKKVPLSCENRLTLKGIEGFFIRKVTKFGNSAKVDCPKQYIGKTVYLVIVPDCAGDIQSEEESETVGRTVTEE